MFNTKVVSWDLLLHEYHLPNQDILFLSVMYLNKLHKSIKYSALPFTQTMGMCRSMMSLSIEILSKPVE